MRRKRGITGATTRSAPSASLSGDAETTHSGEQSNARRRWRRWDRCARRCPHARDERAPGCTQRTETTSAMDDGSVARRPVGHASSPAAAAPGWSAASTGAGRVEQRVAHGRASQDLRCVPTPRRPGTTSALIGDNGHAHAPRALQHPQPSARLDARTHGFSPRRASISARRVADARGYLRGGHTRRILRRARGVVRGAQEHAARAGRARVRGASSRPRAAPRLASACTPRSNEVSRLRTRRRTAAGRARARGASTTRARSAEHGTCRGSPVAAWRARPDRRAAIREHQERHDRPSRQAPSPRRPRAATSARRKAERGRVAARPPGPPWRRP